MQNIMQGTISDSQKSHEEQSAAPAAASVYYETEKTSWTPQWPNWSATETETLPEWQPNFITGCLAREENNVSEVSLAMNANVEDCGIAGDCTLLMRAAKAGRVNLVKWLINHGIDVNTQSTFGNTPLMYGCAGGHEEVVRVLLEAGANVEDHNDLYGHTPLMEAASTGRVQIAKILLEHGAGINTHSNDKESALSLASRHGHLEMFHFLLKAGADQIQQSQQPQTQSQQPHSTQLMSHPTHHHLHRQKPAQEIVCSAVDTIEDKEKLHPKRLHMSNNKEQQQQQQHLQTQIIQQSGSSSHTTQEYSGNTVLSVPLPTLLPSLQKFSAGVQIEADLQLTLQKAFEEGFRQGKKFCPCNMSKRNI